MTNIYPVRTWDSHSSTGELMELYLELGRSYYAGEACEPGEVTPEQFEEKRGFLIWGVQKERVTFTLHSNGWLNARFCQDNLDEVED